MDRASRFRRTLASLSLTDTTSRQSRSSKSTVKRMTAQLSQEMDISFANDPEILTIDISSFQAPSTDVFRGDLDQRSVSEGPAAAYNLEKAFDGPATPSSSNFAPTGRFPAAQRSHDPILAEISGDDQTIVDWEDESDPDKPMNWPLRRKLWMSAIVSFMSFGVSIPSSMFSADVTVNANYFNVSEQVMVLGVSLYVLGFACGMSAQIGLLVDNSI